MNTEAKAALQEIRDAVEIELSNFLREQTAFLHEISSDLAPVSTALSSFLLDSGKRLRPLFAYSGYLSTGAQISAPVIKAIASLEFLQACALIHDDLMDGSDTRRGKPSIHRHFESMHVQDELEGFAPAYGLAAAVLLGDLALVWSNQMLNAAGLTSAQLHEISPIHDEMCVELMAGQFLDIHEQTQKTTDLQRSIKIARYKSGKYTIERPLHIGVALSGRQSPELLAVLSAYALPLGEAFQYRDDLLGVFGDPTVTGKPAGDDLREGKRTVLIALTDLECTDSMRQESKKYFGAPDLDARGISILQEMIASTGAKEKLEAMIDQLTAQALQAAESELIDEKAHPLLLELAKIATKRSI
ncbi:MAG: polyprenyl synthetase family protein [Candidatus Planktophila sp.]|nr:polyprenyl synthetase family protein [Candidatus Planktophila sp.]